MKARYWRDWFFKIAYRGTLSFYEKIPIGNFIPCTGDFEFSKFPPVCGPCTGDFEFSNVFSVCGLCTGDFEFSKVFHVCGVCTRDFEFSNVSPCVWALYWGL